MNNEMNLPWKIYFFDEDGKYDKDYGVEKVSNPDSYMPTSRMYKHNLNKLEIRVCDSLDYCIMHWKDGKRIYP